MILDPVSTSPFQTDREMPSWLLYPNVKSWAKRIRLLFRDNEKGQNIMCRHQELEPGRHSWLHKDSQMSHSFLATFFIEFYSDYWLNVWAWWRKNGLFN